MAKRCGVMIPDPQVWDEFTAFVKKKWGKKHSAVGLELMYAIKYYLQAQRDVILEPEKSTHTSNDARILVNLHESTPQPSSPDPPPELPNFVFKSKIVQEVKNSVVPKLAGYKGSTIGIGMLRRLVADSCMVYDKRSVYSRIDALVSLGVLTEVSKGLYRVSLP